MSVGPMLHASLTALQGYDRFVTQGGGERPVMRRFLPDIRAERLLRLHFNLSIPRLPEGVDDRAVVRCERCL